LAGRYSDDRTLPTAESRAALPTANLAALVVHSAAPGLVGRIIRLEDELRLGRTGGADLDLAVDDAKMSRRHATLARRGLTFDLVDHQSSNGTFVNGLRCDKSLLAPGDVVRMGATLLVLDYVDPDERPGRPGPDELVGRSPAFRAAVAAAERAAGSAMPILLLGETGTGKDVLARHVHARSGRKGSFVAVNCAALPNDLAESALFGHRRGAFTGATGDSPGFFAQAEGGTLFLDEIGELPLHQQAKLLRALENHEYVPVGASRVERTDARIVAATNVELEARAHAGGFRNDVYARLAGAVVRLPPLRKRRGDILPLARRFLDEHGGGASYELSAHAAEILLLHPWPRNIRELRTSMQRLALHLPGGGEISRRTLDEALERPASAPSLPVPDPAGKAVTAPGAQVPDREELVARLSALHGNVNRLAEHYGKDPKQIYRWLKRYDLDPAAYRG
jgi:two-component system NtrC family response regulator